jgi:AbrB family looped-hinge helix DNA binding protein
MRSKDIARGDRRQASWRFGVTFATCVRISDILICSQGGVTMFEYVRVGKRGTVVIPAKARRRLGLEEGEMLVMEESAGGLLLKPVRAYEVEVYTPERTAEFMLNNAVTAAEFDDALAEVRGMGLDPEAIPHQPRPTT